MATNRTGKKALEKIEEEVIAEGISFYRKFRQELANGVLPIGISGVEKQHCSPSLMPPGRHSFLNLTERLRRE
jgi:hypothetical protein